MLAFQPISDGAASVIEKKNPELAAKPITPASKEQEFEQPARMEPKLETKSKLEDITKVASKENIDMSLNLDMQSWSSIFNSLDLSMFVSQVFSEFEFVSFADGILTLKKSDELINPTEGLKTEFIEAISTQLDQKISLVIESGEVIASPAAMKAENSLKKLNEKKDTLLENAVIKDILDSFNGKIIDESIKQVDQ
jgi:hypothetical protein